MRFAWNGALTGAARLSSVRSVGTRERFWGVN